METSETMSMRERVQEWKKEKESTNPEPEYEEDGHVVIGKAQPRPAAYVFQPLCQLLYCPSP